MRPEARIKALAKLDGWRECKGCIDAGFIPSWIAPGKTICQPEITSHYLTSYDAIIPLIQKQPRAIQWECHRILVDSFHALPVAFNATPAQLCEALLRARKLWEEE